MDEDRLAAAAETAEAEAPAESGAVPESAGGAGQGGSGDRKEERLAFLRRDREEFAAAYPDVDILALEKKNGFRQFCGSRLYREPATQLYADYLAFTADAGRSAAERAADRRNRSTGAGGGTAGSGLTSVQQGELDEWNRAYPRMKMTAAEFARR